MDKYNLLQVLELWLAIVIFLKCLTEENFEETAEDDDANITSNSKVAY